MIIYLSGKITGLSDNEVIGNFTYARYKALELFPNATIVSPLDIAGFNDDWKQAMLKDIEALFSCTAIYMMRNWVDSKGAFIEHAIAYKLGLTILYENE